MDYGLYMETDPGSLIKKDIIPLCRFFCLPLFTFISQIEVRTIFQWTEALFHFYVLYWNIVLLIRICGVKVALECRHDLTQRALQGGFLGKRENF